MSERSEIWAKLKNRLRFILIGAMLLAFAYTPILIQSSFTDSDMPGIVFLVLPLAVVGLLIVGVGLVLIIIDLIKSSSGKS